MLPVNTMIPAAVERRRRRNLHILLLVERRRRHGRRRGRRGRRIRILSAAGSTIVLSIARACWSPESGGSALMVGRRVIIAAEVVSICTITFKV